MYCTDSEYRGRYHGTASRPSPLAVYSCSSAIVHYPHSLPASTPRTSTSNSSITPSTTPRLSINPFTATRSIRFVVALYSVLRTVSSADLTMAASSLEGSGMVEKDLRTRGDTSLSTLNARRAADARRGVGSGRSIVLVMVLGRTQCAGKR